jgi:hypothetical protein
MFGFRQFLNCECLPVLCGHLTYGMWEFNIRDDIVVGALRLSSEKV